MDDLIAFLRARLDDDERIANAMKAVYPTPWDIPDRGWMARVVADGPFFHEVIRLEQNQAPGVGYLTDAIEHVWRHTPDRVLEDVTAKATIVAVAGDYAAVTAPDANQVVTRETLRHVLKLLALRYADHPDYREEWKP
ncbi:DUF6221 family protein [Amycolatopsis sp. NPDC001319]|uniref:DUF6221 family protein n=1 Tax=unclassified Amycolatopsis TaxID=2618356 RepID=UPI00368892E4